MSEVNMEFVNPDENPLTKTLMYVLRRTWLQRRVLWHMANAIGVNAYIVIHDDGPKSFLVLTVDESIAKADMKNMSLVDTEKLDCKIMNESEYRDWITSL